MKLCLIVHEDRAGNPEVDDLVRVASERGASLEVRVASAAADGSQLAREASAEDYDAVVAAGGDGTLNAVVNGLVGSSTPLGIIPLGTANDFAGQAGIPDDPVEALKVILESHAVTIDTALLNGRHFLNVSTGGIGAETTAETSDDLKSVLGPLAYAITGIRKLTALEAMRLRVESRERQVECDALLFAVGNARTTGGGNALTPRASVVDGLIDVCIVEAQPMTSFLALLPRLRSGEHTDQDGVHYFQTGETVITAQRPVSVNLDGEPMTASRLVYRAIPASLKVYLRHLPGGEHGLQ